MFNKKKSIYLFLMIAGIFVILYVSGESYYSGLTGEQEKEPANEKIYALKYDMIVDKPQSSFWQEVYKSARKIRQSFCPYFLRYDWRKIRQN